MWFLNIFLSKYNIHIVLIYLKYLKNIQIYIDFFVFIASQWIKRNTIKKTWHFCSPGNWSNQVNGVCFSLKQIANLLLVHNIRLGSITSATSSYTSIGHFFLSNLFDTSNFLVHCYKYGSFLKAVEIHSFINTIRRSLSLVLCLTNFITISFIMQSTQSPAVPNPPK